MPLCTIIAGPNGSGKSTAILQIHPSGEAVNTDDYARRLNPAAPESVSLAAGREVLRRVAELISAGGDFSFETTLSSHQSLAVMTRARAAGYRLELVFVGLRSPELHIARVQQRVALGGHDIPTETIRRRYERCFANLTPALRLADQAVLYDNTEPALHTLARLDGRTILSSQLDRMIPLHVRFATAIVDAFAIDISEVFLP